MMLNVDYPSEQAATDDAQCSLADMARDNLPHGNRANFKVRVQDQAGEGIYKAWLDFKGRGRTQSAVPEEPTDE
ncbi:hypothetical protein ASE66_24040 [Bosea sp. Root483D1]|nr:hypothetical protein ASE66_24040 [Bosea sp. Root483D1]